MKCHFLATQTARIKKMDNESRGGGCGDVVPTVENSLAAALEITRAVPAGPSSSVPGCTPKQLGTFVHANVFR